MPESSLKLSVSEWRQTQAASDALWGVVQPQAMYERPVPERHRLVFYLGHLEAFDWNLLSAPLGLQPSRPDWDRLFAFGIDPVDGQRPQDQAQDWPRVDEVAEYGRTARQRLTVGLDAVEGGNGDSADPELVQRLQVAVEHRWMHIETLSYLFHNLAYAHKRAPRTAQKLTPADPQKSDRPSRLPVQVPAGTVTLGQPRDAGFGWDNEFAAHESAVAAFTADRYKVTNGEYLAFVDQGAPVPHFWRRCGRAWMYRGMFGEAPLPLDLPVYVTHEQASAYAAWIGKALPSEPEWQRMAYAAPGGDQRSFPWGEAAPAPRFGNFDCYAWEPSPVQAHPAGASAWGIEGLLGNGWEWTSSRFEPFPGFAPMPFYPGYSADFFDGQHYVLKGGSPRTARRLLRRSFRNWFQPRYPYLYAGFRCVTH